MKQSVKEPGTEVWTHNRESDHPDVCYAHARLSRHGLLDAFPNDLNTHFRKTDEIGTGGNYVHRRGAGERARNLGSKPVHNGPSFRRQLFGWMGRLTAIEWLIAISLVAFAAVDIHVARYSGPHAAWMLVLAFAWGTGTCTLCWFEFFDKGKEET